MLFNTTSRTVTRAWAGDSERISVFFKSCVFTSEKLVNSPRSSPYCATDATCTTARLYYAAHWKRPPRVVDNRIRSESLNQFKGFDLDGRHYTVESFPFGEATLTVFLVPRLFTFYIYSTLQAHQLC